MLFIRIPDPDKPELRGSYASILTYAYDLELEYMACLNGKGDECHGTDPEIPRFDR